MLGYSVDINQSRALYLATKHQTPYVLFTAEEPLRWTRQDVDKLPLASHAAAKKAGWHPEALYPISNEAELKALASFLTQYSAMVNEEFSGVTIGVALAAPAGTDGCTTLQVWTKEK